MKLNKYNHNIRQLKCQYRLKKREINYRLDEFKKTWFQKNDEEIFAELVFCILTPQSKAGLCWYAVSKLKEENLLLKGNPEQLKQHLNCTRFKNKKAQYLISARKLFTKNGKISIKKFISSFDSVHACREWLVKNVKGLGYKEASHFLRNIGFGDKIAILDRHILKNLASLGIIEKIPDSMNKSKYLMTEEKMAEFSRQVRIPLSHLDLLFWYKETGKIFK